MSRYHPWREARRRDHLDIQFVRMPDGQRGCLRNGHVVINSSDGQAERRCTIAHELVHDERQIFPRDRVLRAREERTVEQIAARRLIALENLVEVLCWTRHEREAAAELWVDVPMLVAFVRSLSDEERDWIDEQLQQRGVA
jgi:hypothetical protein